MCKKTVGPSKKRTSIGLMIEMLYQALLRFSDVYFVLKASLKGGEVVLKDLLLIREYIICADQESYFRWGPTLTFFCCCFLCFLMRGRSIKIPLLAGHHRPASETFKWRFASGPMMARH